MRTEKELISPKQNNAFLSKESMKKIGYMQGMYGADSHNETIDKIYEDIKTLMQLKYRFDNDVKKTLHEVFSKIIEEKNRKIQTYDNIMKPNISFFHQMICFNIWGIDPAVKAFYDLFADPDLYPTLLKFMEDVVIGSFTARGWKVDYYFDELFEGNQAILTDPKGRVFKFPLDPEELRKTLKNNSI